MSFHSFPTLKWTRLDKDNPLVGDDSPDRSDYFKLPSVNSQLKWSRKFPQNPPLGNQITSKAQNPPLRMVKLYQINS